MLNYLFIGSPKQNAPWISHCVHNNLPFLSICFKEPRPAKKPIAFRKTISQTTEESQLAEKVTHILPFDLNFYNILLFLSRHQFVPNFIVNASEIPVYLELEYRLNKHFQCVTYLSQNSLDFFAYKSTQDKVCKKLGIPIIPKQGEYLCVKRDAKNFSTSDDIPKTRVENGDYVAQAGEFVQAWLSQKENYLIHRIYIDSVGNYHLLTSGKLFLTNNLDSYIIEPYELSSDEFELVHTRIRLLCGYLEVRNRFLHWQWVRCANEDTYYHMDLNSRIGGDLHTHRADHRVFEIDYAKILLERSPPPQTSVVLNSRHSRLIFENNTFTESQVRQIMRYEGLDAAVEIRMGSSDAQRIVRRVD